jgi:hypothetical protein
MTEQPPAGRETASCPPWCTVDHHRKGADYHGGDISRIGEALIRAIDSSYGPAVLICTGSAAADPYLWLKPADAETLAVFIRVLDVLPRAERRKVAAAIRKAAAVIANNQAGEGS